MRPHSAAPLRLVAILWAVVLAVLAAPGVADDTPDHELRLWKDASGSFQVRAKLIERTDGAVRLRKTDGKEISVPLAKLSQADQEYVDKATAPKPVVVVPEREPRGLRRGDPSKSAGASKPLPDTGRSINPGIDPVTGDFEPDPLNFVAVAELGSVPVCDTDAYDAVSAPKPADAACSKVLVGRPARDHPVERRQGTDLPRRLEAAPRRSGVGSGQEARTPRPRSRQWAIGVHRGDGRPRARRRDRRRRRVGHG